MKKKIKLEPAKRLTIKITRLGRHGDGVAVTELGQVFIPFALPGEQIEAEVRGNRGKLMRVVHPVPERSRPPCQEFGICGGCSVQQLKNPDYHNWKRGTLVEALTNQNLIAPVDSILDAHGEGRRRVTLHARPEGKTLNVGFMRRRTWKLHPISHCMLLTKTLSDAPAIAKRIVKPLGFPKKGGFEIGLTETEAGIDADIKCKKPVNMPLLSSLAYVAEKDDLARLTLNGEIVVERRRPVLTMGVAEVSPVAGGFLQATQAGEEALSSVIRRALPKKVKVLDLFSGIGPFALRLAMDHQVHASDSNGAALQALDRAWRNAKGLKPITTETRDLFDNPYLTTDFNGYGCVLFNPPRSGAKAQVQEIARSAAPLVIAVSCNPVTFARDAAILVAGGYKLDRVTPIDQFRYSAHVEIIGVFRRVSCK